MTRSDPPKHMKEALLSFGKSSTGDRILWLIKTSYKVSLSHQLFLTNFYFSHSVLCLASSPQTNCLLYI